MKKLLLLRTSLILLALCTTLFIVASCGVRRQQERTLPPMEPTSKEVEINSEPQGASVYMDGKYLGITPMKVTVPLKYIGDPGVYSYKTMHQLYEKSAELSSSTFLFVKQGYEKQEVEFKPTVTSTYGVPKNYNGKLLLLDFTFPEGVFCSLERSQEYTKDTTIPAGEAYNVVSRDNPGGTELEQTIIRWYFDSAPRGARVFWRVISSIPAEVKNTNELYLGPTPFEETRSFNILGLTYANSRDVQIEIKVTKNGYMDQVKRFNVRQAIDQQEISSFFELVPTE